MFDITPNRYNAIEARFIQCEKVKKSIQYLINECARKIKINNSSMEESLLKLSKLDRLSPEVHHYHHALQAEMRVQNVNGASLTLSKLINSIINMATAPGGINISSISTSEWEQFIVNDAINLTKNDCGKTAVINPTSKLEADRAAEHIRLAFLLMADHDFPMLEEVSEHVSEIRLFNGEVTMGLTDVRMLGAMFIRLPRSNVEPILYFLEHIIHEASHIHLNCLMAVDPCILNSSNERFVSPLRTDLRPMVGVFHATYVSARVARTLMKIYAATEDQRFIQPLAESLDEVIRGVREVEDNARLSPSGKEILTGIKTVLELGRSLSEWKRYDFTVSRVHRFGTGLTKVSALEKLIT